MTDLLSVIVPAYNEAENVAPAAERILGVLAAASIPCELIFVDDGSQDGTFDAVAELSAGDERVRGASFSRNFGKEAAIFAGLSLAKGACCVTIDCDMQHPPEKIPEMYALWRQGYQVVEGRKSSRGAESGLHRAFTRAFYGMMSRGAGADMSDYSDFKLLDRSAVDSLLSLKERGVFYRALSSWVGFRTACVTFDVQERQSGATKWSTAKLFRYAVNNITSFSNAPLVIPALLGAISLVLAVVFGVTAAVKGTGSYCAVLFPVFLMGGLILLSLGILGYYVGKVYDEARMRPRYIISRTIGDKNGKDQIVS